MKLDSTTKRVDLMPAVKHYISELGLYEIFKKYIPKKANESIEPAQVLCTMIMNIICARHPLYKIRDWLSDYTDGITEAPAEASGYDDNRFGRKLDDLFDVDRHCLLAEISGRAIHIHNLETGTIHNDTTSVSLTGAYENHEMGSVNITYGYNKDHKPHCKQIVFGLNITDDGNVPLTFQLFDGNQTDDHTHMPIWDELRLLIGGEDFIYVADCKLCNLDCLIHIHFNGGIFITLIPANRKEVKDFHNYIKEHDVEWSDGLIIEDSRKKGEYVTYKIFEYSTTKEGFRVIWVHSSQKEDEDCRKRDRAIEKVLERLSEISGKLNKNKLKTRTQIETAVTKACKGKAHLFNIDIIEDREIIQKQTGPGKPGPNTRYEKKEHLSYRLEFEVNDEAVRLERRTDGTFPLITNSNEMRGAEVLKTYKNQAYLEKRMYTAKSVLKVTPMFLKTPRRIEAMLFLYFVALMIVSLIERNVRNNMQAENIETLPILPAGMKTKTPTWDNLSYLFRNVHLAIIREGEKILSTAIKGLTKLHYKILRLLNVPKNIYQNIKDRWWLFD